LAKDKGEVLPGMLDMLVLRALHSTDARLGITERIEQWSERVLQLGQGAPYPALYRLEPAGPHPVGMPCGRERPTRAVLRADIARTAPPEPRTR
jgi:hypothetical protein